VPLFVKFFYYPSDGLGEGEERGEKNRKIERGIVRYITDVTKKLYPLVLLSSIAIDAQRPNSETRVTTRHSLVSE
jgi:hypothetical protein